MKSRSEILNELCELDEHAARLHRMQHAVALKRADISRSNASDHVKLIKTINLTARIDDMARQYRKVDEKRTVARERLAVAAEAAA